MRFIPDYRSWIVKLWHFGQDSFTTYSGEMFEISWWDSLGVFHLYSKRGLIKKKVSVRKEVEECPKMPWFGLFVERCKYINKNGAGFFSRKFSEYLKGDLVSNDEITVYLGY